MNLNSLSRFGKIFVVSGIASLCLVHPRMLTWQDHVFAFLGYAFLTAAFWMFAIRSIRTAKQPAETSSTPLLLALFGSIALAFFLFFAFSLM